MEQNIFRLLERDPNIFEFGYMPLSKLLSIYHIVGRVGYTKRRKYNRTKSTSYVKSISKYEFTKVLWSNFAMIIYIIYSTILYSEKNRKNRI